FPPAREIALAVSRRKQTFNAAASSAVSGGCNRVFTAPARGAFVMIARAQDPGAIWWALERSRIRCGCARAGSGWPARVNAFRTVRSGSVPPATRARFATVACERVAQTARAKKLLHDSVRGSRLPVRLHSQPAAA